MRSNYPLLSQELNDIFLSAYERYVSLLGYVDDYGYILYSGQYDIIQKQYEDVNHNYIIFDNEVYPNPTGISIPYKVDSLWFKKSIIRGQ